MRLPAPGDVFEEKYRLERVIGSGGFGRVYAGVHLAMGRSVAIKILTPGDGGYDPARVARFLREAKVVGGLRSPHVVSMYEFGRTSEGLLFMVFELLHGRDLSDVQQDVGRLPEPVVVHVLRQLLDALQEAHAAGLLHRDLKPQNIRVFEHRGDPFRVKLLDFGIAKSFRADQASLTQEGKVVGTPRYMSPEQLTGEELAPRADLYSLGLVAYEMLLGTAATANRRITTQAHISPADPVSSGLRGVVNRMLAFDQRARFQSAAEVLAALDAMDAVPDVPTAADEPPTVETRQIAVPAAAHVAPAHTTQPDVTATGEGGSPWPLRIGAIATFAALLIAAGRFLAVSAGPRADAPPPAPAAAQARTEPADRAPSAAEHDPAASSADAGDAPPDRATSGCGRSPSFARAKAVEVIHGLSLFQVQVLLPQGYDPEKPHPIVYVYPDATKAVDEASAGSPTTGAEILADGVQVTTSKSYAVTTPMGPAPQPRGPQRVALTDEGQMLDARLPGAVHEHSLSAVADRHGVILAAFDGWGARGPDPEVTRTLMRKIERTLCVDPTRRFAFGVGTGAFDLTAQSCQLPFAAIATASFRGIPPSCGPGRKPPHIDLADASDPSLQRTGVFCIGHKVVPQDETTAALTAAHRCGPAPGPWQFPECGEYACEGAPLVQCVIPSGRPWPPVATNDGRREECFGPAPTFAHAEAAYAFLREHTIAEGDAL